MRTDALFEFFRRMSEPIRARVTAIVSRATVVSVDDSKRMQTVQLKGLFGETLRAERFQNYGMTSVPLAPTDDEPAEAVVACPGGSRDHPLATAVDDRRHRPTGLEPGEVQLYDHEGSKVYLKEGGVMRIEAPTRIELAVGQSSIVITDGQITLTSPLTRVDEA